MNNIEDRDSWYKRCSSCKEWRITDMKHCWLCGEVLGPPCTVQDIMASKQSDVIDIKHLSPIYRLWQTVNALGYKHEEEPFIHFFEALNKKGRA